MENIIVPLGISLAGQQIGILGAMANRHGLIAGATGTGKTVTLQTLAEAFSRNSVPVFTADIKGDLSGLSRAGVASEKLRERLERLKLTNFQQRAYPVLFWDVFAKNGHPLRTTISEMGPLLLSRLLDLNDIQAAVLQGAFSFADDQGMLLLDLKDLRALVDWMGENADELQGKYGNIAKSTVGAIQRALLTLESAGGERFFGEPALKIENLMQRDFSGNGVISVIDATALMNDTRLYTVFLLWLLSELFEQLPEVGDLEKPKMVFFFDEAHLLFKDVPKAFVEKIEQVVRLIRSKGVGVYFVTQNPLDIPESILAQLGNRVQHALRAFTPRDQRAVQSAAETFRPNRAFKAEEVITSLAVGEALVSVLDEKGIPTPVERVLVLPPESRIGPISAEERADSIKRSPIYGTYEEVLDRESAFELIAKRRAEASAAKQEATHGSSGRASAASPWTKLAVSFVQSAARSIGTQVGRQIIRGVLGSLSGRNGRN